MNVHHLELFYYVAKHGGVSAAARLMPYGIQQPAISAQILQLEDSLGHTLFHRRPFKLTPQGATLYAYIEPFFGGLTQLGEQLRGGVENRLRISTPEIVQREYLPILLQRMRNRVPDFHFTLSSGRAEDIEQQLLAQNVDVGLAVLAGKRSDGIQQAELLNLPLVLLVPANSPLQKAEDIWKQDRIDLPLITLPANEPVCRLFQEELQRRKLDWFPTLELTSLDLVNRYVAEGFGVGLGMAAPTAIWPKGVRSLPLSDFPPVSFGALWLGKLTRVGELFVEEAGKLAGKLTAFSTP